MKINRTFHYFARPSEREGRAGFTPPEATLFICCKTSKESASGEEKQKEILDSIHYAKRIQQALLPNEKIIAKILNKK